MILSKCQKITICITTIVAIIALQFIVISLCSFQTKAKLIRVNFILVIQIIMFTFSLHVWKTFSKFELAEYICCSVEAAIVKNTLNRFRYKSLRKSKNSEIDLSAISNNDGESPVGGQRCTLWKSLVILYLGMCHTSYLTNLYFIGKDPYWIGLIAYTCLGSFIQLNTGLIILKSLSYLLNKFQLHQVLNFSISRSQLIGGNTIAILSSLYMVCATVYGLYNAAQPPIVKDVRVPIRDLPLNLRGLKIIQLSDIHLGPTVGFSKLNKIVNIVNEEKPDVVVVTGDLVDGSVQQLDEASQPLSSIQSKYGKYFVTGNHEYYTGDVDNWFSMLTSMGFTILHNSHVLIPNKTGQDQICLAGTDDVQANQIGYGDHKFDLTKAVTNCSPLRPVLLLAHQPKAAKMALDSPHRIDMILSGHTHGGQMFPMMIGAYLMNPFFSGLYQYNNSYVYVSQGTQYWGIPMRIASTMEITRITLHSPS